MYNLHCQSIGRLSLTFSVQSTVYSKYTQKVILQSIKLSIKIEKYRNLKKSTYTDPPHTHTQVKGAR